MATSKEIDNWLDDHTGKVEAPAPSAKAPSTDEIDAFLDDKASLPSRSPSIVDKAQGALSTVADAIKQHMPAVKEIADAALDPMSTLLRKAPDMAQRSANFVQGKPNTPAQTPLEAMGNRPDVTLGTAATMIPGAGLVPAAARVAGTVAANALNPQDRSAGDLGAAGGLQAALEALPYGAGKIAPAIKAIMSKASGVDTKALQQLFENPSLLFTGPNMQEARALYKSTAEKIGLSSEVSDNVLFDSGKKFVRKVVDALNASEDVPTQTLLDARQTLDDLTEAAKRSGKMNKVRGFTQRRDIINAQITAQAPDVRVADQTFSQAATRDQFMNPFPMNANGTPSVAKTVIGTVAGVLPAVAMSPYVQGLATSAAGAVAKSGPTASAGLQALRQYILNQRTKGPGSR